MANSFVPLLMLSAVALAGEQGASPPEPVRILVAASRGRIIPQSKGGGGFQRTLRFTASPGKSNRWIMQRLEVRGTVFDAAGAVTAAHLDVVEYYRTDGTGRAIEADSHYSQYWDHCGGDLTITSTLTYGTLAPKRLGDTILGKSFLLASARDAAGNLVTMKTRTTRQKIYAERGTRVEFAADAGCLSTRYSYRVRWDTRAGSGSRTQPSGEIAVGTWEVEAPAQTGSTRARATARAIPDMRAG